jgi:hypothetical protein
LDVAYEKQSIWARAKFFLEKVSIKLLFFWHGGKVQKERKKGGIQKREAV